MLLTYYGFDASFLVIVLSLLSESMLPKIVEMPGCLMLNSEVSAHELYDHRPYQLNSDDYERVCQIPKKKVRITEHDFLYFLNKSIRRNTFTIRRKI